MTANNQTTQQEPTPQFPTFSPYIWQDIGIIGFVVVSLAIALGKWLPDHLRDERDQKLLADSFSTLMAKNLQGSHELLENLAVTQLNISRMVEAFELQQEAIAKGFEQSTKNQARTIELLEAILEALSQSD
jgi:hypothetical protein